MKGVEENGFSSTDLAKASKANPTLIGKLLERHSADLRLTARLYAARTMKHIAAMNVVSEIGADNYTATPLSNALTEPKYRDGIIYT